MERAQPLCAAALQAGAQGGDPRGLWRYFPRRRCARRKRLWSAKKCCNLRSCSFRSLLRSRIETTGPWGVASRTCPTEPICALSWRRGHSVSLEWVQNVSCLTAPRRKFSLTRVVWGMREWHSERKFGMAENWRKICLRDTAGTGLARTVTKPKKEYIACPCSCTRGCTLSAPGILCAAFSRWRLC